MNNKFEATHRNAFSFSRNDFAGRLGRFIFNLYSLQEPFSLTTFSSATQRSKIPKKIIIDSRFLFPIAAEWLNIEKNIIRKNKYTNDSKIVAIFLQLAEMDQTER